MDYFVIGFDGASDSLFSKSRTPFINSLISEGINREVTLDLISRGWVELISGEHAIYSNAFYEKVNFDKTYSINTKYSFTKYHRKNLWEMLNKKNYTVGIMNIPTTFPAPKVKGFFVSGGGGGLPVSEKVHNNQVYPKSIKKELDEIGYITDVRLSTLFIDSEEKNKFDIQNFFRTLNLMNKRRVEAYLSLYKKMNVNFGFIVFRSVAVVEYLSCNLLKSQNELFYKEKIKFYKNLDKLTKKLINKIQPKKICLCSDHSIVPAKWFVNFNPLLVKYGFQKKRISLSFLRDIKNIIPVRIKKILKKNKAVSLKYYTNDFFCPIETKAFFVTRNSGLIGLFINDFRFGNHNVNMNKSISLSRSIASILNKTPEFKNNNFNCFSKHDSTYDVNAQFFNELPDIVINKPDGFQPSLKFNLFLKKNKELDKKFSLNRVKDENWLGSKGKHPLFCFIGESISNLPSNSKLTDLYEIVKRNFKL